MCIGNNLGPYSRVPVASGSGPPVQDRGFWIEHLGSVVDSDCELADSGHSF